MVKYNYYEVFVFLCLNGFIYAGIFEYFAKKEGVMLNVVEYIY